MQYVQAMYRGQAYNNQFSYYMTKAKRFSGDNRLQYAYMGC